MRRGAGRSIAARVRDSENSLARRGLWSVIRTVASTENPLFSQASMSAAAGASSRRASRNQRITRQRTRSVSAARSAGVIGRTGRNAGGASPADAAAAGSTSPTASTRPGIRASRRWTPMPVWRPCSRSPSTEHPPGCRAAPPRPDCRTTAATASGRRAEITLPKCPPAIFETTSRRAGRYRFPPWQLVFTAYNAAVL